MGRELPEHAGLTKDAERAPEASLDAELLEALAALAHQPVLLVATDYDGTLAEVVLDPSAARPEREAVVALQSLTKLPQTHVAVISGRALADLAVLLGHPDDLLLVGSHGSEFDLGFAAELPEAALELRQRLSLELAEIAAEFPGCTLEHKPASVALHYRGAAEDCEDALLRRVEHGPARIADVHSKLGKKVVELAVVATDKGVALERLRNRFGASAAIFVGDDATDESAFATLAGPDVSIKVGEGPTLARWRLHGPLGVARALAHLAETRTAWLAGSDAVAIERHSLLSDQRALALVAPPCEISWLCAPRLDSPALFAKLVGGDSAGRFAIEAADGSAPLEQRYVDATCVLETRWKDFRVLDYLDASGGRVTRRAGRTELVRRIEGPGRARIVFAPRVDFGRASTRLAPLENGLEVEGGPDPIFLIAPGVEWRIEAEGSHQTAVAEVCAADGLVLELRYGGGAFPSVQVDEARRRDGTLAYWRNWTERLSLPSVASELVLRSALALKALCYGPTGGIAAAATTSLPEHLGGVRNWDYRYTWLRDAALSAEALVRLGSHEEAMHFLDWVLAVVDGCDAPEYLRPLYTVTGSTLGPEADLAELSGYAGSRPVRVGNAAGLQVQLDVFGPIVQLVWRLARAGAPLSTEHGRLVEAMVAAVAKRWQEPDHGIWELRGPRRHHVHTKVMCWLAAERAHELSGHLRGRPWPALAELRDAIAEDVLANGWSPTLQSFTAAYGVPDLDASALHVGLAGLLPRDDPRFDATVRAVEAHLRVGPTVYRYRCDDGLPGIEGGFHLCAQWLVDAFLLTGRRADAEALFEAVIALAGPTGLFSEQYDPKTRRALGNHPQAYTHLGLIHNAMNLAGV